MPETMSVERRNLLKALGAEIVLTDGLTGMASSIAKAKELRDAIPGAVILQQFENPLQCQYAVYPSSRYLPAKVRILLDFMRERPLT